MYFQSLALSSIEWHQREFLLVVLEKRPQFEVVLRIQVGLHGHIVLDQFKELLLELVDFGCDEEGVNECEVCVREITIVPYFLRDEEGAEDEWPPVGRLQRNLSEGNQAIYVHQADNAAFGPTGETGLIDLASTYENCAQS